MSGIVDYCYVSRVYVGVWGIDLPELDTPWTSPLFRDWT